MKTIAERKAFARTLASERDATCESEATAFQRVFLPGCFPSLASDISEMSSSRSAGRVSNLQRLALWCFCRGGEKKWRQVGAGGCILFGKNKENTDNGEHVGFVTTSLLNADKNKHLYRAQAFSF